MELFSHTWLSALLAVVLLDLVLVGENAIVIALAARNLTSHRQIKAIFCGTVVSVVERFPVITYAGAAVLAYTAAQMIVSEPLLDAVFDPSLVSRVVAHAIIIAGVLAAGRWAARRHASPPQSPT